MSFHMCKLYKIIPESLSLRSRVTVPSSNTISQVPLLKSTLNILPLKKGEIIEPCCIPPLGI